MSTMEKQRAGPVLAPGRSRRSFTAEFKADDLCLRKTRRVAEELTNSCRLLGVVVVVV